MYEIEKNIPIPGGKEKGRKTKYPWSEMKVSDSFFIPDAKKGVSGNYSSVVSPANKRFGTKRFIQRAVNGGLRVWRIK